jgi:hypothetical protein
VQTQKKAKEREDMKKVLFLLLMSVMALGAKNVFADAIVDSQQADGRIVDSVDVIFAGYVNKVLEYKNNVDFRLNNASGGFGGGSSEWGGVIDGKHEDIGVLGIYVNRPNVPFTYNGEPALWSMTGGQTTWTGVGVGLPGGALPPAWIGFGGSQVAGIGGGPSYATLNGLIPTPVNKVDIFWAKDSGDSNFGIGVNYGDNQASNGIAGPGGNGTLTNSDGTVTAPPAETNNTYARTLGVNVGLGLKNAFWNEVNIHAGYNYGTFAVDDTINVASGTAAAVNKDSITDDGIYTITLGATASKDMDKDTNMRLFLDGKLDNFATKASFLYSPNNDGYHNGTDTDYENKTSWSQVTVNAGLGCNHKVNDGAAVVGSSLLATWVTNSTTASESLQTGNAAAVPTTFTGVNTFSTDSWNLSWGVNVDSKIASWLNARAGLRKSIFNRSGYKATIVGTTNTITGSGTADAFAAAGASFSTGFGVHFQNWAVNGNVTAASLEGALAGPQPGNGIFYGGPIVTVSEIDLGYAF